MPMMFNAWPRGDPTFVATPVRRSSLASCGVGSNVLIIGYVTTSCRPLPSDGQKASAAENGFFFQAKDGIRNSTSHLREPQECAQSGGFHGPPGSPYCRKR